MRKIVMAVALMVLVGGFSGIAFANSYSACLPTAQFNWWIDGLTVRFDASCPHSQIIRYGWIFGDNNRQETSYPQISHRYPRAGTYRVILGVIDVNGRSNSVTQMVTVPQPAPRPSPSTAQFTWQIIGTQTVRFDASCSHGSILRYEWDFGDDQGRATRQPQISHNYRFPGNYLVTLKVTDIWGGTDSITEIVVVPWAPRPPEATETVIRTYIDLGNVPPGILLGLGLIFLSLYYGGY